MTTPTDLVPAPELTEDFVQVQSLGLGIKSFIADLKMFFSTARALEVEAVRTRTMAELMTPPTNADEDLVAQELVRRGTRNKKAITAHWAYITGAAHSFHKMTTGARAKAVAHADIAIAVAQNHHNVYVESERRRVAAEQARLQREAEEQALAVKMAELRKLEEEVEVQEALAYALSAREGAFVQGIARGLTPVKAAEAAYYVNAEASAKRLMASEKIQKAIAATVTTATLRQQLEDIQTAPLDLHEVPVITADVIVSGDRTTWSGEILDAQAFMAAVLDGSYGIPADVLTIDPVKLNEYARALRTEMNRWPGVRAVSKTRTI